MCSTSFLTKLFTSFYPKETTNMTVLGLFLGCFIIGAVNADAIIKRHKHGSGRTSILHEIRQKLDKLDGVSKDFCDFYKGFSQYHNHLGYVSGAVYTRWGRTTCPENGTTLIYSGYAGGVQYNVGGAADYLCLPKDPTWGTYKDGVQGGGAVYGSEYQTNAANVIDKGFHDKEVPCVVCQATRRYNVYMLPGRAVCHGDWHLEYKGYLMSGHYNQKASEYVCLDGNPETVDSKSGNENGRLLYPVEARCGSLKCPPYVEGRELTCAVCTK